MTKPKIAFIGGSGIYEIEGIENTREITIETPFGNPSDRILVGRISDTEVAFLPRHGKGHKLSPTEIPSKANIYALKSLGIERLVSLSAVGSLQSSIEPLDLVVPDQVIDWTKHRSNSFFGDGIVAHTSFADPFCSGLRETALQASEQTGAKVHNTGTYIVIEGPQFSTRAESAMYRSWGADVIGMTAVPEARLAREAELCYVTLAFVTDYDVWHNTEAEVSVDLVIQNLTQNVAVAHDIIKRMLPLLRNNRNCPCQSALENALITNRDEMNREIKNKLGILIDKYVNVSD